MQDQHASASMRRSMQIMAIAVLVAVVAALAVWAGSQSAIAADTPSSAPATVPVQAQEAPDDARPDRGGPGRDCPERDGGSGGAQDGAGSEGTAL